MLQTVSGLFVCMWLHARRIINELVCVKRDASKSGHVDLMSQSLSLSDLSHRCAVVACGGGKSNI